MVSTETPQHNYAPSSEAISAPAGSAVRTAIDHIRQQAAESNLPLTYIDEYSERSEQEIWTALGDDFREFKQSQKLGSQLRIPAERRFDESIASLADLPLNDESLARLDERLFGMAVSAQRKDVPEADKQLLVAMSLQLGVDRRADAKLEMISQALAEAKQPKGWLRRTDETRANQLRDYAWYAGAETSVRYVQSEAAHMARRVVAATVLVGVAVSAAHVSVWADNLDLEPVLEVLPEEVEQPVESVLSTVSDIAEVIAQPFTPNDSQQVKDKIATPEPSPEVLDATPSPSVSPTPEHQDQSADDPAPQPPANQKLTKQITGQTDSLNEKISDADHADKHYENTAKKAVDYLNQVVADPTALEDEEIKTFVKTLPKAEGKYHERLYDQYHDNAEKQLESRKAGALKGYDDAAKSAIIDLYAYAQLASISDDEKAQKIADMKAHDQVQHEKQDAKNDVQKDKDGNVKMPEKPTHKQITNHALKHLIDFAPDQEPHWENTAVAMEYFVAHGLTAEQAAGIIGNLLHESAGTMDPSIEQYGDGPGRGLAQWGADNPDLDRFGYDGTRGLVKFAEDQGKSWQDLQVQLDYILHEFNTTESAAYEAVMTAQSVHEAAQMFEEKYERAGVVAMDQRYAYADMVYKAYVDAHDAAKQQLTQQYQADKAAADVAQQRIDDERREAQQQQEAAEHRKQQAAKEKQQAQEAEEQEKAGDMSSGQDLLNDLMAKYGNLSGKIDASELSTFAAPYGGEDGGTINVTLQHEAAEQFQELDVVYKAKFGESMAVTDHYRDYDAQVKLKADYEAEGIGNMAADPGTSNHGWGLAVDMGVAVGGGYDTEKYQWMAENAPKYGWANPGWAKPGQDYQKSEPWHWEYLGAAALQNPDGALKT